MNKEGQYMYKADKYIRQSIHGLYPVRDIKHKVYDSNYIEYVTKKNIDELERKFISLFGANIDRTMGDLFFVQFMLYVGDDNNTHITIDIYFGKDDIEIEFLTWMRSMDDTQNSYLKNMASKKGYNLTDNCLIKDGQVIDIRTIEELKTYIL